MARGKDPMRSGALALVAAAMLVPAALGAGPVPTCDAVGGCEDWTNVHDGDDPFNDIGQAIAESRDGSTVYVAGHGVADGHNDAVVVAIDAATGETSWIGRYDSGGSDTAWDAVAGPGGDRVYVAGYSVACHGGSCGDLDMVVAAFSASDGDVLWAAHHGSARNDLAWSVDVSDDGSTVVVGGSLGDPVAAATIAHDAATGAVRWSAEEAVSGDRRYAVAREAVATDDRVYTAATRARDGRANGTTTAYDLADGSRIWQRTYDGPGGNESFALKVSDLASSLDVAPDGGTVVVSGTSWSDETGNDIVTLAYGADGSRRWVNRYAGPGVGHVEVDQEVPCSVPTSGGSGGGPVIPCPDGHVFVREDEDRQAPDRDLVRIDPDGERAVVAASSMGNEDRSQVAVVAYDLASGDEAWVQRIDGLGSVWDPAHGLDVARDRVAVGGASWRAGGYDYLTTVLDATDGSPTWTARYDGPIHGNDVLREVAIVEDRVVATGAAELHPTPDGHVPPDGTAYNLVTVAYRLDGPSGPVPEAIQVPRVS